MEILRKMNRAMYTTRFSIFDMIWIVVLGTLATNSYWYYLLLLPVTAFSVIMEKHLSKE